MHLKNFFIVSTVLLLSACAPAMDARLADADLVIGYDYLKGTGGKMQDAAKAVEYFVKAAEQGSRDAQYNVGLAYVRGEGVVKDFAKAYEWFTKSAYQDDAGAQYNLGVMTLNGEGITADPLAAYVWFMLASEKAYGGAKEGMDSAREAMTEDQRKDINAVYAKVSSKITKPAQPVATSNVPL